MLPVLLPLIDVAPLGSRTTRTFARRRPGRGVAVVRVSAFYAETPVRTVVRFCFAKPDATLDGALDRLGPASDSAR